MEEFVKECSAHHSLRHPYVIEFFGVCLKPLCIGTFFLKGK